MNSKKYIRASLITITPDRSFLRDSVLFVGMLLLSWAVVEIVHASLLSVSGRIREPGVFRWNGHEDFSRTPPSNSPFRLKTSLKLEPKQTLRQTVFRAEESEEVDSSTKNPPGLYAPGTKLAPGASVLSFEKTTAGRLIYSVRIHVDQFGRRVTVNPSPQQRRKFAIFLGCSFTFGEGVSDGQTLPSQFAKYAPNYDAYNYGIHGSGPFRILDEIRSKNFEKEVIEKDGMGIYVFIDAHVRRTTPSIFYYLDNGKKPYFEEDAAGDLVRFENYDRAHPIMGWLYRLLAASPTLTYYRFDHPPRLALPHYQRTARVIKEVAETYRRRFGNDRFYVLLFPGDGPADVLPPLLERYGVKYLDYQGVDLGQIMGAAPLLHPKDPHPTAGAYEVVAKHLAADLGIGAK